MKGDGKGNKASFARGVVLSEQQRSRVDRIVSEHIKACLNNGFPPDNLERVTIEAVEIVIKFPDSDDDACAGKEYASRSYEQYKSPVRSGLDPR